MPSISIVTSFNRRIYGSRYQIILEHMQNVCPDIPFYVYHENSYEKRRYSQEIEFEGLWGNLNLVDLFDAQPNMEEFIYGENNPFNAATGYWNKNAKFWVRKVFAIQHCLQACKADYMIWTDADVKFLKPLDNVFFEWLSKYDIAFIKRFWALANDAVETGFICFKVTPRIKKFADDFLDYYLSREFVKQFRWDDSHGFTVMTQKSENQDIRQGYFDNEHLRAFESTDKSPFDIYDYIFHHKGPLVSVRSKE